MKMYKYTDLIDYFSDGSYGFMVREVVEDMRWELEAYYIDYINSYTIRVVFYPDIVSPQAIFDIVEWENLITKIKERYNYVKKSLQSGHS